MYDERKETILAFVLSGIFIVAFLIAFYWANKTPIEVTPEDAYQPVHVEEEAVTNENK